MLVRHEWARGRQTMSGMRGRAQPSDHASGSRPAWSDDPWIWRSLARTALSRMLAPVSVPRSDSSNACRDGTLARDSREAARRPRSSFAAGCCGFSYRRDMRRCGDSLLAADVCCEFDPVAVMQSDRGPRGGSPGARVQGRAQRYAEFCPRRWFPSPRLDGGSGASGLPAGAAISLPASLPTRWGTLVPSTRPGVIGRTSRTPAWACTRWGLPCPARRRAGGALLPHPFTLT